MQATWIMKLIPVLLRQLYQILLILKTLHNRIILPLYTIVPHFPRYKMLRVMQRVMQVFWAPTYGQYFVG